MKDDETLPASGAGTPVSGDDATIAPSNDPTQASAPAVIRAGKARDYARLIEVTPDHYALGDELARGGMGRILTARDRRLGRTVAIKELLHASPSARARFEREVRITARLQHPSIVSVHEAGAWPNGEPFYAMKLVAGQSLDRVIAERTTLDARLGLLAHVIAAVDALAYAHAQGVIHRDLKPANVLVGDYGETVVIDWGLAKDLTSVDADAPDLTFRPGAGDQTVAGSIMGTPGYMPPEQATGDELDARADVYALGAMLYHLLAGRAPYAGPTADSILAAVVTGPPKPLASVAPGVAADLVAIVEKAMARDPADRYRFAGELAEDLKRFQTGQLVGVHRYSAGELFKRWLRRHRTAVLVGTIATAALAVVAVVSVLRIVREKRRAETAQHAAERAQGAAEHQRDQAEDLSKFMLVDLRGRLSAVGRLDLLDAVATKVRDYYTAQDAPRTDAERINRATHHVALAEVLAAQGKTDAAIAAYRAAQAMHREILDHDPGNDDARRNLGSIAYDLGNLIVDTAGGPTAVAELEQAEEIARARAAEKPDDLALQRNLIFVRAGHAYVLSRAGQPDAAVAAARDALAMVEPLRATHPDDDGVASTAGVVHRILAETLIERDPAESLVHFRAALAIAEARVRADPANVDAQDRVASDYEHVGDALSRLEDPAAARPLFEARVAVVERLAAQDPTSYVRRMAVAGAKMRFGNALKDVGDPTAALVVYREARAIYEELLLRNPTQKLRGDVIINLENIGQAVRASGDPQAALEPYLHALALTESLIAEEPTVNRWRWFAGIVHENLGDTYKALGRKDDALREHRLSATIKAELVARDPANVEWKRALWTSRMIAGDLLRERGDLAEALKELDAGLVMNTELLTSLPDHPTVLRDRVVTVEWLSRLHRTLGHGPEALQFAVDAIAAAERLLALDPTSADYRQITLVERHYHALALELTGARAEALRDAQRALDLAVALRAEVPDHRGLDADLAEIRATVKRLRR